MIASISGPHFAPDRSSGDKFDLQESRSFVSAKKKHGDHTKYWDLISTNLLSGLYDI